MGSTTQEFKAKNHKTETLPSGLIVEIRRVWQIDLIGAGELPLPHDDAEEDQGSPPSAAKPDTDATQKLIAFSRRVILAGAVDPRFTDSEAEASQGQAAYVRELSQEDFFFLANAILSFSGASKEAKAEADSFRPDAVGGNGAVSGAGVRDAAKSDTETKSG